MYNQDGKSHEGSHKPSARWSRDLAVGLQQLRDQRSSPREGLDITAKMDTSTAEIAAAIPLSRMPQIGNVAPKFELMNHLGSMVSLNTLLAGGPAVLVFYRGGWCPFCSLTLRAYSQHLNELRNLGASLVAISLQTLADSVATVEKNRLGYDVLSDLGGAVSRAYGLIFRLPQPLQRIYRELGRPLPIFNGTDDWALPLPATFVVDGDAIVRFTVAMPDHTHRVDPVAVVAAVKQIVCEKPT